MTTKKVNSPWHSIGSQRQLFQKRIFEMRKAHIEEKYPKCYIFFRLTSMTFHRLIKIVVSKVYIWKEEGSCSWYNFFNFQTRQLIWLICSVMISSNLQKMEIQTICKEVEMHSKNIHWMPFDGLSFRRICPLPLSSVCKFLDTFYCPTK